MVKNILSQFLPVAPEDKKPEFNTGLFVVKRNTFAVGNSFYQIRNISGIDIFELVHIKKSPAYPVFLMTAAIIAFFVTSAVLIKAAAVAVVALSIYILSLNRRKIDFELVVYMNSGRHVSVTSQSLAFLKEISLLLYNVIENGFAESVVFNLASNQVTNVSGSVINTGHVEGSIANTIINDTAQPIT